MRDGPFFDRPYGLAGYAIKHINPGLFRHLCNCLDGLAVHGDVQQNGSGGIIPIPNAVMNELIMPDAFAGARVHADQAFVEQIVTGAMAAIEIAPVTICSMKAW